MNHEKIKISGIKTAGTFLKVGTWSETLLRVLNQAFNHPMKTEENAVMSLAGGIMQHGYQCGMIWGSALAAGAQAYHIHGKGPKAEYTAINTSQKIVEVFRKLKNSINCIDITEIDKTSSGWEMVLFFLIKGGTIGCLRLSAQYAKIALEVIQNHIDKAPEKLPKTPVSCSALVAKKMGASEIQTTMAAGLAGGIGLCGGACGALGSALWINGIRRNKDGKAKMEFDNPEDQKLIDEFMKNSDFEFECSKITGRKFESIEEHADFIKNGGCEKIINVLAK